MKGKEERLEKLDKALATNCDICSSEGTLCMFPCFLLKPFILKHIGLILCEHGNFTFTINKKTFSAHEGECVFLSEGVDFCISEYSEDLAINLFFYRIDPIRDILGSSIMAMYLYMTYTPEPCYVWTTGEEEDFLYYFSLLNNKPQDSLSPFDHYEHKLLLLALTYRLCAVYSRRIVGNNKVNGHKIDTFIKLIHLVEKYYMEERGVAFYADKLCLSPKYLSALVKSICGYTVQELVFRAIVRKSIFWLKNTQKTIQEIADDLNFPNASAFGTFFKKQVGLSPFYYRCKEEGSSWGLKGSDEE
jgi:AraC family transcriptional activator of pobA